MKFDTSLPQGAPSELWPYVPMDTYTMKIVEAEEVDSTFKDERTGQPKKQIRATWEIVRVTPEQEEAGAFAGYQVKQWMAPYPGYKKDGSLSMLGKIVKPAIDAGELQGEWDEKALIGMVRRVNLGVEEVIDNNDTRQHRNKVLDVGPLSTRTNGTPPPAGPPSRPTPPPQPYQPTTPIEDTEGIMGATGTPEGMMDSEQLAAMSREELVDYARTLADEAGSFWAKKKDWDQQAENTLRDNIGRMQRYIARQNEDPNKALF